MTVTVRPALVVVDEVVCLTSQAAIDFPGIGQSHRHLTLMYSGALTTPAGASADVQLMVNGDISSVYWGERAYAAGAVVTAAEQAANTANLVGRLPGATATPGSIGAWTVDLPDYTGAIFNKHVQIAGGYDDGTIRRTQIGAAFYLSTSPITRLTLTPDTGAFAVGTIATLYGWTRIP